MAQSTLVLIRTMVIYNVYVVSYNQLSPWCKNAEWRKWHFLFLFKRPRENQGSATPQLCPTIQTNEWTCVCVCVFSPLKVGQPSCSALFTHQSTGTVWVLSVSSYLWLVRIDKILIIQQEKDHWSLASDHTGNVVTEASGARIVWKAGNKQNKTKRLLGVKYFFTSAIYPTSSAMIRKCILTSTPPVTPTVEQQDTSSKKKWSQITDYIHLTVEKKLHWQKRKQCHNVDNVCKSFRQQIIQIRLLSTMCS